MTGRDPELTADVELRNTVCQLQVYGALAVATNEAHAALDAMPGARDPESASRALEQIEQRRQELADRVLVLQAELSGP